MTKITFDSKLSIYFPMLFVVKLLPIVNYKCIWDVKYLDGSLVLELASFCLGDRLFTITKVSCLVAKGSSSFSYMLGVVRYLIGIILLSSKLGIEANFANKSTSTLCA